MATSPSRTMVGWLVAAAAVMSSGTLHRGAVAGGSSEGWQTKTHPRIPVIPPQVSLHLPGRLRGGTPGNDAAAIWEASGDGGWDIEDAAGMASSECGQGIAPAVQNYLTPSDLHDLEAPIRRKEVRNPKGYYVYNRTADRWESGKWHPLALPGEDQFHRMFWQRRHPMMRTARRGNETLEDFVRRCPCWPPYCRKCPLRPTPSLTASSLALHERITGKRHNISLSLRCGVAPPFSPEAAQDLGGYCPPRSVDEHLDSLLQAAVEDDDIQTAAMLLRAGANVSVVDAYGMSPLHEAAFAGFADMCRLLLDFGAQWDSLDTYQRTPFHWAAYFGKLSALVAMVDHEAGGGSRSMHDIHAQLRRQDYLGDTPVNLAEWMGRLAVAKYFKMLVECGREAASVVAARGMQEEARWADLPQPSALQNTLDKCLLDGDTAVAEGPAPAHAGEGLSEDESEPHKQYNEYLVGPPGDETVNRVPWGPGTSLPTPWECWFCNKQFATYQLAHDHETACSRLHGWEINQEEARQFADNNPDTCPGGENGIHSVECVASRVPFAWVRVQDDMEFDAQGQGAMGSGWMTTSGSAGEGSAVMDLEDIGERQVEAEDIYAMVTQAHSRAVRRQEHEFVGGGWSKMARNTRRRQEEKGWWAQERMVGDRARGSAGPETNGSNGGAARGVETFDGCISAHLPELDELDQFPPERARELEKLLEAVHGVLPFNFSAVDNGTRPVGVPTLSALQQLPEYLRNADAHRRWKFGEDIQPPEMERPLGVGSDLKAKLGKRDVKRLGGAVDGEEATQASSILRKKAIANMNKEAVMARLDGMGVRFDEVQGVATLRSLLVGSRVDHAACLRGRGGGALRVGPAVLGPGASHALDLLITFVCVQALGSTPASTSGQRWGAPSQPRRLADAEIELGLILRPKTWKRRKDLRFEAGREPLALRQRQGGQARLEASGKGSSASGLEVERE